MKRHPRDKSPEAWNYADLAWPEVVAEGGAAWTAMGQDGEETCPYNGDKRVAWLIGFYDARTKSRVKCMNCCYGVKTFSLPLDGIADATI